MAEAPFFPGGEGVMCVTRSSLSAVRPEGGARERVTEKGERPLPFLSRVCPKAGAAAGRCAAVPDSVSI